MFAIRSRVGKRPSTESNFRRKLAIDSLEDRRLLSATGFTPHELFPRDQIVEEVAKFTRSGDVDGDGDQDLISVFHGRVVWHENLDGAGSFAAPVTIATEDSPINAFVANVDGDSDPDILAMLTPSRTPSFVNISGFAWYERSDGGWALRDRFRDFADAADFADVDGDGDLDQLTLDYRVGWHENDGGTFLDEKEIWTPSESEFIGRRTTPDIHAADIDADGDVDALSITPDFDVVLHENTDGRGTFVTHSLIPNPDPFLAVEGIVAAPQSVHAADIDGDDDLDILTVSGGRSGRCDAAGAFIACDLGEVEFAWYENNGSVETIGPKKVISIIPASRGSDFVNGPRARGTDYVNGMRTVDFDGDGDKDVLAYTSRRENSDSDTFFDRIVWYENLDGKGTFAPEQFISTKTNGLKSIDVADLDGDDDLDVVAAYGQFNRFTEEFDGNIVWFENEERVIGDSNRDGIFDSADLIAVFQSGEYEDELKNNSSFEEGDWNGDGDFDSGDLVAAFQSNQYVRAATINAPAIDLIFEDDHRQEIRSDRQVGTRLLAQRDTPDDATMRHLYVTHSDRRR